MTVSRHSNLLCYTIRIGFYPVANFVYLAFFFGICYLVPEIDH
jgi:hypothetical protein